MSFIPLQFIAQSYRQVFEGQFSSTAQTNFPGPIIIWLWFLKRLLFKLGTFSRNSMWYKVPECSECLISLHSRIEEDVLHKSARLYGAHSHWGELQFSNTDCLRTANELYLFQVIDSGYNCSIIQTFTLFLFSFGVKESKATSRCSPGIEHIDPSLFHRLHLHDSNQILTILSWGGINYHYIITIRICLGKKLSPFSALFCGSACSLKQESSGEKVHAPPPPPLPVTLHPANQLTRLVKARSRTGA